MSFLSELEEINISGLWSPHNPEFDDRRVARDLRRSYRAFERSVLRVADAEVSAISESQIPSHIGTFK